MCGRAPSLSSVKDDDDGIEDKDEEDYDREIRQTFLIIEIMSRMPTAQVFCHENTLYMHNV